jgi:hypothetical protein
MDVMHKMVRTVLRRPPTESHPIPFIPRVPNQNSDWENIISRLGFEDGNECFCYRDHTIITSVLPVVRFHSLKYTHIVLPKFELTDSDFHRFVPTPVNRITVYFKTVTFTSDTLTPEHRASLQHFARFGLLEELPAKSMETLLAYPVPNLIQLTFTVTTPLMGMIPGILGQATGLKSVIFRSRLPLQMHWLKRDADYDLIELDAVIDNDKAVNFANIKIKTKILHLKNCSQVRTFNFLQQISVTCGLMLGEAHFLKNTMLLLVLSQSLTILCLENAPEAVDDDLLALLKINEICLKVLLVPLADNDNHKSGFTDNALQRFLQCKDNRFLQLLDIEGHSKITKNIWQQHWACIKTIRTIKVRRTAIYGIEGLQRFEWTKIRAHVGLFGLRFARNNPSCGEVLIHLNRAPWEESIDWATVLTFDLYPRQTIVSSYTDCRLTQRTVRRKVSPTACQYPG